MKRRKIFQELLKQKEDRKISFLLGARQVGKTTLLRALHNHLCTENNHKGIFLDLDILTNYEKVNSFGNLLNLLKLNGYEEGQNDFFYLFFDEFQRYGDLSIVMKNTYDNLHNVKIYASGSSSIKIKSQIQESLAGRKKVNIIYPLDFEEFLWFKEDKDAIAQFQNAAKLSGDSLFSVTSKLNELLAEFLVFGGYPEVALKNTPNEKIAVLDSIFDLYIKKDLVEYLNIKKVLNVKRLIEFLAINNGQKIKYEEIGQSASLEYQEVISYIEILKETHVVLIIRPFFTNKNKELVKIPKIYFIDSGVRNYFINNFNALNIREDKGFLFEGFAISELIKSGVEEEDIKFWQDKNKHEVDIVIDEKHRQIPIEVKFKTHLKSEDFKGLKIFMEAYKIKKGHLVNLDRQEKKGDVSLIIPFEFVKQIFDRQKN